MFVVPHQLARLFLAEEEIVAVISRQQLGLAAVDSYLQSWRARYRELRPRSGPAEAKSEDGEYLEAVLEKLVGNPVHVYTLLDRLVTGLPEVMAGNIVKTVGRKYFLIILFNLGTVHNLGDLSKRYPPYPQQALRTRSCVLRIFSYS